MLTPGWYRFFGVELGAVSGLTGLVLVAVSINLNLVLGLQGLSGRAAEALIVPIGPSSWRSGRAHWIAARDPLLTPAVAIRAWVLMIEIFR